MSRARETKWSMDDLMQILRIEENTLAVRRWVEAHEVPPQPDALAILDNFEKCFRAADFGENDDDRNACRQYLAGLRRVLEGNRTLPEYEAKPASFHYDPASGEYVTEEPAILDYFYGPLAPYHVGRLRWAINLTRYSINNGDWLGELEYQLTLLYNNFNEREKAEADRWEGNQMDSGGVDYDG